MALFIERARAVRPEFAVTDPDLSAVAAICRRLDGLPLAIELAAVRIKLFSPEALLSRLSNRLGLLTCGPRDLPARQQTLRHTFDWSYALLSEAEQRFFRRLAVFVDGLTEEAAAAVCMDAAPPDSEGALDLLASLVDQSLLRRVAGEPRFAMLETVREYGLERLEASGEAEKARQMHARFFLDLAERAAAELSHSDQVEWHARLEREHANLRAALDGAVSRGDAEVGLRLAGALCPFWDGRQYQEGREYLALVLALPGAGERTAVRARALVGAAARALDLGELDAARALAEESLAISRELGDRRGVAAALARLGIVTRARGNYAEAWALLVERLQILQDLGNRTAAARSLERLAATATARGCFRCAARLFAVSDALRHVASPPAPPDGWHVDESSRAAARAALGDEAFAAAWAEGEAMTLEQTCELVLADAARLPPPG